MVPSLGLGGIGAGSSSGPPGGMGLPGMGLNLDLSKAQRNQEENNQDSQREPMKSGTSSQTGSSRPKLGLDIIKAQNIQQESLKKNEEILKKARENT